MYYCKSYTNLLKPNATFQLVRPVLKRLMSRQDLKEIFLKAVECVQPQTLIAKQVKLQSSHLLVRGENYQLQKPCYVVGFGKAVLGMAIAIERTLENHLQRGVVTVPSGIFENWERPTNSKIEYIEGARNNMPDKNAERGALMIKDLVEKLSVDDLLIVLVSGGGSALLPLPVPPITLEEKIDIIKKLANRGANILELNAVRKQLSVLKGGGLAEAAYPCRVVSLVLSDIIGDPLDFIASGATVPNEDPPGKVLQILKKYSLYSEIPNSVKLVLQGNNKNSVAGIPVANGNYSHVKNYVIGNNSLAAEAACTEAIKKGFQSVIVSTKVDGDANRISEIYTRLTRHLAAENHLPTNKDKLRIHLENTAKDLHATKDFVQEVLSMDFTKPICLIFAGELTVVVKGSGKGGRNQHLALAFSVQMQKLGIHSADILFLSAGTDGIDGPTDAAGALAVCNPGRCLCEGVSAEEYLENNDSYGFYKKYDGGSHLVKIGHTGTNVMDIHILTITPKASHS